MTFSSPGLSEVPPHLDQAISSLSDHCVIPDGDRSCKSREVHIHHFFMARWGYVLASPLGLLGRRAVGHFDDHCFSPLGGQSWHS